MKLVDNLKDWYDCLFRNWDIFHMVEKQADTTDRLNSLVRDGAILEATAFRILAEVPSGPLDLVASSLFINHCTSSTVHRKSSGH